MMAVVEMPLYEVVTVVVAVLMVKTFDCDDRCGNYDDTMTSAP